MSARKGLLVVFTILLAVVVGAMATVSVQARPQEFTPYRGSYSPYPPETMIWKGKELLQATRIAEGYYWKWYDPETESIETSAWRKPDKQRQIWPHSDKVSASKILAMKIDKPEKPDRIILKSYDRKDMSDKPIYLKPGWYPEKENGNVVGWVVLFKLEKPHANHRVHIFLGWEEREKSDPMKSYGWQKDVAYFKTY